MNCTIIIYEIFLGEIIFSGVQLKTETYKDVCAQKDTPALVFVAAPDHWGELTADNDNKTFLVSLRPAEDLND